MVIETRASSGSKVNEGSNSGRTSTWKSSLGTGSASPSGSGLRRSARERDRSLSKGTTPGPSSTWKSGRLEKQTPTRTGVKRKVESSEKDQTVSRLTRSGKSKNQSSAGDSKSKKSAKSSSSLSVDKGSSKEKSMVQLTVETREVNGGEGDLSKVRKRFSARAYKALFKKKDGSTAEADSESPTISKRTKQQLSDVVEIVDEQQQHEDNMLTETTSNDEIALERVQSFPVSKRKRKGADSVSEGVSVSDKNVDISPSVAVAVGDQSPVNYVLNVCAGGLKRQRVDDDGKQQELCSLNKQLGEPEVNIDKHSERDRLQNDQNCDLKPKIAALCEVLQLPDDVKGIAVSFLEYVVNYHHVTREPETKLQAFQIALCWTAASLRKYKIEHKESLVLAKELLNFGCKKDEADYVYSMLRCWKKVFTYLHQSSKSEDHLPASSSSSISYDPQKMKDGLIASQEPLPSSSIPQLLELADKDFSRSIKDINKKCDKEMRKLLEQQEKDKEDLFRRFEVEKAQLQINQRAEAAVIRCYSHISKRPDKLKTLENEYAVKFEELEHKRVTELNNLEAVQSAMRKKLEERKVKWVEGLESWAKEELMPRFPPKETGETPDMGEEITPIVKSAAEAIHETPSTGEITPVEVPSEPLASSSAESEQPLADKLDLVKDGSLQIHGREEAGVGATNVPNGVASTGAGSELPLADKLDLVKDGSLQILGREEARVGVTNLPNGVASTTAESEQPLADELDLVKDGSLQIQGEEEVGVGVSNLPSSVEGGEPILAVPQIATTTGMVDNEAHGEIENGEIIVVEEVGDSARNLSSSAVKLSDTVIPAVPEIATTTGMVDNEARGEIEDGEIIEVEEVGDSARNLSSSAVKLLDTMIPAVPGIATSTGMVDNEAHGQIEDGEIIVVAEDGYSVRKLSSSAVKLPDTVVATEVIPNVDSSVALAVDDRSIEQLSSCDVGSSNGIPVQLDEVTVVGDSIGVVNEVSADKSDRQTDGSTMQDVLACIPGQVDSSKELSAMNLTLTQPETSRAGILDKDLEVNNADTTVPNLSDRVDSMCVDEREVGQQEANVEAETSRTGILDKDIEVRNADSPVQNLSERVDSMCVDEGVQNLSERVDSMCVDEGVQNLSERVDSMCVDEGVQNLSEKVDSTCVDEGEVGQQEGTLQEEANVVVETSRTGILDKDVEVNNADSTVNNLSDMVDSVCVDEGEVGQQEEEANAEAVRVEDPLAEKNGATAEILDNQIDGILMHDTTTNQDGQSQEIVQTNPTLLQDSVVSDVVDVADLCQEHNRLSTEVGQQSGHSQDMVIPLVPETIGNSCRENDISTQLDNETIDRVLVQDGLGDNSLANSTSPEPEAAVSAQVSQSFSDQPASTVANIPEGVSAASASAIGSRLLQAAPVYRVPLPLGHDPLQNELDRVRRDMDQIASLHEKTKLQLRIDCEKEIEEAAAKIRRKYDATIHEKESEYVLNKLDLDAKHNKIMMNKILADTFRSKCMDVKSCNSAGVLQDSAASFMQQMQHSTSQSTQPSYSGPPRFSTAAMSSPPISRAHPVAHSSTAPSPPSISRAHPVAHISMAPPPHPVTLRSMAPTISSRAHPVPYRSSATPPPVHQLRPHNISTSASLQTGFRASAPYHINTISPTTASPILPTGGFRAPAPHLQAYRATTSPVSQNVLTQNQHRVQNVLPTTVVPQTPPSTSTSSAPVNAPSSSVAHRTSGSQGSPGEGSDGVVCLSDDD